MCAILYKFALEKQQTMTKGKLIVVSAPSGCGKSTIIGSIMDEGNLNLTFSVSATNRAPRTGEEDGVHYHFMSTERFREAVESGEFIEWEEVYPGRYYGTLRSEVDLQLSKGHNVILDIDVKGAVSVKKIYGDEALTIFIQPPSIEELRRRLVKRGTDNEETINTRVGRAEYELSFAPQFDTRVVNDNLEKAIAQTTGIIEEFIS